MAGRILQRHNSGADRSGDAEKGGLITKEDLAAYKAVERTPIAANIAGIRFTRCHRHLPVGSYRADPQYPGKLRYEEIWLWSADAMQIMAEAEKYAYADRSNILAIRILSKSRGRR